MDRFASITAFVRVAESGGFSAAGRRLNLSKATVSDQVQALENALGVVASGLPLGFQGGFPRNLLSEFRIAGRLLGLSEPPHERQLRRLAQRPRQQPHELHWPTWRLFARRCGHREPP